MHEPVAPSGRRRVSGPRHGARPGGRERDVSMLAYDGPPPQVGDWVVVHSGYALAPAVAEEAEAVLLEFQALGDGGP